MATQQTKLSCSEIWDGLADDEDSDIEEVQDEEIEGLLSNIQTVVVKQELRDDDFDECSVEAQAPEHLQVHPQWLGHTRFRRGHRGRSVHSTTREASHKLSTLREIDEANGWMYELREEPLENPVFKKVCQVLAPLNDNSTEYDCFCIFFPEDFWELVKTQTNRYAAQMKAKQASQGLLTPGGILANWKELTLQELKHFMSIIIHMTLVRKENFDAYWSTRDIIHTPFASKLMSRDRFRAIYSCLHLNDNAQYILPSEGNYDAFFKLRPYFDRLQQLCAASFYPDEALTIDEGTCGFRGRVHSRVYNKAMPDKYGMKVYMLCDSRTGYVFRMVPYVGDSKSIKQIVTELSEPYFGKWHTIYMDRFFTSPTLIDSLWLQKTRVVGTVMLNQRGLPQMWRHQTLEVNEMSFAHRGHITACKWKGKRDVLLLTTKHAASWREVTVNAKGGPIKKFKPNCVLDYNANKIGVNLNNQYVSYYSLNRKNIKWWKKMFFHLIATAMVNAYVLFITSRTQKHKISFSQFLLTCGESLIGEGSIFDSGPSPGPHIDGNSTRLFGRHFIERIKPTEKKTKVSRVCKVCADVGKKQTGKRGRKETVYYCPDCNVPLCYYPCFKIYHTKKDYCE